MADVNVTLNKSGDSVTYEGYVLNACSNNDQVSDGSWSPTSNQTGMTVSASGSSITITNSNTSSSDASSIFTWTSSKLSNCSKTLSVTAKGKPETYIYIYFSVTAVNNLSDDDGDLHGNITYYINGSSEFSYGFTCSPGGDDGNTSSPIKVTFSNSSVTVKVSISVAAEYYGSTPSINISESSNIGFGFGNVTLSPSHSNQSLSKSYSTSISKSNITNGSNYGFHITISAS